MIVCRQCGEKKKVQRMPKHHATWECSTCAKAARARTKGHYCACLYCHKSISIRPQSASSPSAYYLCAVMCVKVYGTQRPLMAAHQPGQILVHDMNAAGELDRL